MENKLCSLVGLGYCHNVIFSFTANAACFECHVRRDLTLENSTFTLTSRYIENVFLALLLWAKKIIIFLGGITDWL